MKIAARPVTAAADPSAAPETDRSTRDRVCREILEHGPITTSTLAGALGLTPAAVRRHLDGLLADGLVATWDGAAGAPRGRGRPARRFVLTDAGHAAMATGYDDLAAAAVQFIAETGGEPAVRAFAGARAGQLVGRYRPAVRAAGHDPRARAAVLARLLSTDGYAASTRAPAHGDAAGVQLCQGHCPVQHVAARFPQLCEAETAAFSDLLGVHVQRLATLAHGEHVCTTHVPAAPATSRAAGATPGTGTALPAPGVDASGDVSSTSTATSTPTTSTEETTRR